MAHQIIRAWSLKRRGICRVSTRNPVHGPIERGRIEHVRGEWVALDQDHIEIIRTMGDYLDAENALLAATIWAEDTEPWSEP